jgi:3-methyladenine DNA glycosylase Tag
MPAGRHARHSRPKNLAGYLEALSRPVFQAGMSWRVVDSKWDGIRKGFVDFDPDKVAKFGPKKVDRLLADEAVIRSRPKIEAVIDNAQTLRELDAEHGGIRRYLKSFSDTTALVADLQRQFRFIGPSGAYTFLWLVGEQIPTEGEWPAAWSRAASRRRK